jgi:hypothetical protein
MRHSHQQAALILPLNPMFGIRSHRYDSISQKRTFQETVVRGGLELTIFLNRGLLESALTPGGSTGEAAAETGGLGQRTISDEHRERLIRAGYIREVVAHSGGVSALALTGRGLRRLEKAK